MDEELNVNKNEEIKVIKPDNKNLPAKPKKPMSLGKKIGWIIIAIIVFIIIVQVVVADKYSAQVLVISGEKQVGINPTAEKLDFGDLSADTAATRYVNLQAGGVDTYIWVWQMGEISELVKLNENNFVISKGEEKRLEFTLYMPPSAPVGQKYVGNVWIFKIPKIW